MKTIQEYPQSNHATGPGVDDMGDMSEGFTQDESDDSDRDSYVFEKVGKKHNKMNSKFGDDLEVSNSMVLFFSGFFLYHIQCNPFNTKSVESHI